jgi:hypothetical protein
LFRKAATTAAGRVPILKEIIQSLYDYNLIKEGAEFLKKFPPESMTSDDFLLVKFLIFSKTGAIGLVLDQGRALLAKGIADERLFSIMISKSMEANLAAAAEDLLRAACLKFPAKKAQFDALFKASCGDSTA